jgi:hypothetical protein
MSEEGRSWSIFFRRQYKAERMLREEALEVKYSFLIMMQTSAFRTNNLFGTGMLGRPDYVTLHNSPYVGNKCLAGVQLLSGFPIY